MQLERYIGYIDNISYFGYPKIRKKALLFNSQIYHDKCFVPSQMFKTLKNVSLKETFKVYIMGDKFNELNYG